MNAWSHTTVLLNEAVDALVTDPRGQYVDATFGRGGHARLILQRLAPVWPSYHLNQLALSAVGMGGDGDGATHVAALCAFTVACLWLAVRRLRRYG